MKNSLWLKITAAILLPVVFIVFLLSLTANFGLLSRVIPDILEEQLYAKQWSVYNIVAGNHSPSKINLDPDYYDNVFQGQYSDRTNFCFEIASDNSNSVYQSKNFSTDLLYPHRQPVTVDSYVEEWTMTFHGASYLDCSRQVSEYSDSLYQTSRYTYTYDSSYYTEQTGYTDYGAPIEDHILEAHFSKYVILSGVTLTYGIRSDLPATDLFSILIKLQTFINTNTTAVTLITVTSGILFLLLGIYLVSSAGHKKGIQGIYLNWFNRIPFDLFTFLMICAAGTCLAIASEAEHLPILFVFLLTLCIYVGIAFLLSTIVRIKSRSLLQNTVCMRILRYCKKLLLKLWSLIKLANQHLPLYWKAALGFFGICVADLIIATLIYESDALFLLVFCFEKFVLLCLIAWYVVSFKKLLIAEEQLSSGDLTHKVNLSYMPGIMRQSGTYLNSIHEGMLDAVSQQMRSERMKTELITNVSHDLKTPLTSIINYIDLLKKEPAGSEAAADYIEVLDRQANRLKKLTVDLVEVSKASSGAIAVDRSPTDINLVLAQSLAEYAEKLELANLTVVTSTDPEIPEISADGRLLWRAFDNLLNNICKYALPGTRVYINTQHTDFNIHISFKNISKAELNISADELMERFVRGDSSRHTEGSGLGLSIARSLVELHHGRVQLSIDGDLFKVDVILPLEPK